VINPCLRERRLDVVEVGPADQPDAGVVCVGRIRPTLDSAPSWIGNGVAGEYV
jgi:hypothetical protein